LHGGKNECRRLSVQRPNSRSENTNEEGTEKGRWRHPTFTDITLTQSMDGEKLGQTKGRREEEIWCVVIPHQNQDACDGSEGVISVGGVRKSTEGKGRDLGEQVLAE